MFEGLDLLVQPDGRLTVGEQIVIVLVVTLWGVTNVLRHRDLHRLERYLIRILLGQP